MAGRSGEVPVHPGCAAPLISEWVGAQHVHGMDGMGDAGYPQARQRPEDEHAVDALVRLVNESPGELTILAQGPLTNIAAAAVRDPTLPEKVEHLWVMGGGAGNITPAAEYNFYVDPEAAKIALAAGFRTTLFTWSVTLSHGVFDDGRLAEIDALDTDLSRFFAQVNSKASRAARTRTR
jgi:purine nucleosidase